MANLSFPALSKTTLFLVALSNAKRVSELHAVFAGSLPGE